MVKWSTVLLIVLTSSLSSGSPIAHLMKRQLPPLCGTMLAQALTLVCGDEIYGPQADLTKRGDFPPDLPFFPPETRRGYEADANRTTYGRQTRGIVEECCRKPCSMSVLQSYCGK